MAFFQKVLIKVSGEFLAGQGGEPWCLEALNLLLGHLEDLQKKKIALALVLGGGNFVRGKSLAKEFRIAPLHADRIGMLSTVLNGIFLERFLKKNGREARAFSALSIDGVAAYDGDEAQAMMLRGGIPICVGGIANPFFSTDTAAVLRAVELKCDLVIKGTQVDGIYDSDPLKNENACMFDQLTYAEILKEKLAVMDMTAVALAQENKMPLLVCAIGKKGSIDLALEGKGAFTRVMS